jgi:SAM-dependent methyltransferase
MTWVCPEDRAALVPRAAALACAVCGRSYPLADGVPHFARSAAARGRRSAPVLDELLEALVEGGADGEALAAFCRRHGCARSPYRADWKFFVSVPERGTTLELGSGFGDDTLDLAGPDGRTVSVVPSEAHARLLRQRGLERGGHDWPVAVLTDLSRLPLADGSVHAIALEDAAAPGFGLSQRNFAAAAAEWQRVLVPGGAVFVGVANGLHRLPGLGRLRAALRARPRPDNLNRSVKRWAAPELRPRLRAAAVSRTMAGLGFRRERVYAPLPDENDTQVVIPVDDARVVRYFLDNLVRKNSRAVRAALFMARALVAVNLFRQVVPYYYLIFRRQP